MEQGEPGEHSKFESDADGEVQLYEQRAQEFLRAEKQFNLRRFEKVFVELIS